MPPSAVAETAANLFAVLQIPDDPIDVDLVVGGVQRTLAGNGCLGVQADFNALHSILVLRLPRKPSLRRPKDLKAC